VRPIDILLRAEWLAVLVLAVAAYAWLDASWWLFALLILAPDLSMLGYLAGPRAGAAAYNSVHALPGPVLLALAGLWGLWELAMPVALIWLAHIAVDRMLGYGLKLSEGFSHTHLGRIGRG
jgi:hypothetical protein